MSFHYAGMTTAGMTKAGMTKAGMTKAGMTKDNCKVHANRTISGNYGNLNFICQQGGKKKG